MQELIVHERMLVGAVDSFMGGIVHVRPHIAGDYRDALETLSEAWLASGGANHLAALDTAWLRAYLCRAEVPAITEAALRDLLAWAIKQELISHSPLS